MTIAALYKSLTNHTYMVHIMLQDRQNHTHACTQARTHACMHARMHTRMHARTHAHTQTHKHIPQLTIFTVQLYDLQYR